jgi:cell division protease FtsH
VIAYHEAGHALISEMLPSVPKVHKISIVPRGQALGYTLNLPEEDRYLMSKEDLLDYMKMLLGGYVTEQIVFERVTTGAADDLRRVAEISRSMIEQYGMGSKLLAHLDGTGGDNTSQAMLQARDDEQQTLIDEAQFEARMLVADNRDLLDRIAQALLKKESIDRGEIVELVSGVHPAPRHEIITDDELEAIVSLPSVDVHPEAVVDCQDFVLEKDAALPRARRESVPPPQPKRSSPQHG